MLDPLGSAEWWLIRLGRKLAARRPELARRWDWYIGNHPLPEGSEKAKRAFRDFQEKSRTNFM
ncbi:hypothetical protein EHYA_02032 [Embleya hyalina]|uniref:Uncharacterized protein n=1 Tax=Embleya hyalina TaxID=516124 RepID=A0A401YIF2_9ACTN|nr:hypothetical protein EHYA_02032 [Embleya hyalina]